MQALGASSEIAARPRRPRLRRIALALGIGLVLTIGLLEAGLWVAYALHAPEVRVEPLEPGTRTILCAGDSNTYGVHLPREESYPGQLQSFLRRAPDNPWRVVNIGYPGRNTAEVRGELARALAKYQPEIVIAWVGTNNTWSGASRHLWETPDRESAAGPIELVLQNMRVLKLGRMVLNKLAGRTGGPRAVAPDKIRRTLDIDWPRIQALCAEGGAKLLMADYPVHIAYSEKHVNENLERISEELDIPLVPLHDELLPLFYGLGYKLTMFGDFHANGVGNHEVARRMLHALIEAGYLESRPEWLDVEPLWSKLADWPLRIIESSAERATVLLHGPPGARYRLRLMRVYTIENDKTINAPIKSKWYEDLSEEDLAAGGWVGVLDAQGGARIELALPPEPAVHPEPQGRPPVWLGWQLNLALETAEGPVKLPEVHARKVVLLDPALRE